MSSLRVYTILLIVLVAYVYAQGVCQDAAADCNCKRGLCVNQMYRKLLMKMCNATCGFCTPTPAPG